MSRVPHHSKITLRPRPLAALEDATFGDDVDTGSSSLRVHATPNQTAAQFLDVEKFIASVEKGGNAEKF